LASEFLLPAVTNWMGNSQLVESKHHLQMTAQHFSAATSSKVGQEVGQKAHEVARRRPK